MWEWVVRRVNALIILPPNYHRYNPQEGRGANCWNDGFGFI
jgi:hypothetical protein